METEDDFIGFHITPPPPNSTLMLSHPKRKKKLSWQVESHLPELLRESEIGRTKAKFNSHVSSAQWIPGQRGTLEFLSPLSRITVSWNWKHREVQILTLLDICMTLGMLNELPPSAYASTYRCAYQTMASFFVCVWLRTAETKKQPWREVFVLLTILSNNPNLHLLPLICGCYAMH